jgi:hypothetical protein
LANLPASLERLGIGLDQGLQPLLIGKRLVKSRSIAARFCDVADFPRNGSAYREDFRFRFAACARFDFGRHLISQAAPMRTRRLGYGTSLSHHGMRMAIFDKFVKFVKLVKRPK